MVTNSLDAMASGGIYDHLGGGFSRYSVDAHWIVPHFEKMLYDNALLARVYLHAWQITGKPRFRQVLDEIITYVLRDLCHDAGGFYSAEDADSEGEEGKFYVSRSTSSDWYSRTACSPRRGRRSRRLVRRHRRRQLRRPQHPEPQRALPHARRAGASTGRRSGPSALLAYRNKRVRPGLDDKVLTEWNGLMLACARRRRRGHRRWGVARRRGTVGRVPTTQLRRADGAGCARGKPTSAPAISATPPTMRP